MVVVGIFLALLGSGAFSNMFAQARGSRSTQRFTTRQDAPGTQRPEVVQLVGPVSLNQDLRTLPYIPQEGEIEDYPLMRYPHRRTGVPTPAEPSSPLLQSLVKGLFRPTPTMPPPLLTFDGINSVQSGAVVCRPTATAMSARITT
jgi:hypothetical protein